MERVERISMTCDWCGISFPMIPSRYRFYQKRGTKKFFCKKEHKIEWNKTLQGYWKGKNLSEATKEKIRQNKQDTSGSNNPNWKGGRRVDKDGYILIWKPSHPYSDYHGYMREHRLVMEEHIGRILDSKEVVHHIDLNKQNNKLENLMLFENAKGHNKYHFETGQHKLPPGGKKSS